MYSSFSLDKLVETKVLSQLFLVANFEVLINHDLSTLFISFGVDLVCRWRHDLCSGSAPTYNCEVL